MTITLP